MDDADWAWATGLFEGEGTITHIPLPDRGMTTRCLAMQMTDRDILERFRVIVDAGNAPRFVSRAAQNPNHKDIWAWKCSSWPDVERILTRMLPLLGERRRAKAEALLADPAETPNGEKTHCPQGHPYSGANLRMRVRDGYPRRECRACANKRRRRRYAAA